MQPHGTRLINDTRGHRLMRKPRHLHCRFRGADPRGSTYEQVVQIIWISSL